MNRASRWEPLETLELLCQRYRVIDQLGEPKAKNELLDVLDISRSTVDRAIRDLENQGLITVVDGEYQATPVGAQLTDAFHDFLSEIEIIRELEPLFQWLPPGEFDLDPTRIDEVTVTVADKSNPYAPVNRHVETLETADHTRVVLPVVGQRALETVWQRIGIENEDLMCELVVDSGAASTLRSDPQFASKFEDLISTEKVTVHVYTGEVPFYLGVIDDTVQIGVGDADGVPRALGEITGEDAVPWANNRIDQYQDQAHPLPFQRTQSEETPAQ